MHGLDHLGDAGGMVGLFIMGVVAAGQVAETAEVEVAAATGWDACIPEGLGRGESSWLKDLAEGACRGVFPEVHQGAWQLAVDPGSSVGGCGRWQGIGWSRRVPVAIACRRD